MTYHGDVAYIEQMQPVQAGYAADDFRRLVRVINDDLPSLRGLGGRLVWKGQTRGLVDLRLSQAAEILDALKKAFSEAGTALDGYTAAQERALRLVREGRQAEGALGQLIAQITDVGTDALRRWEDLRSTDGFFDWLSEIFQQGDINRLRAEADGLHKRATTAYRDALEVESEARKAAVEMFDRARRSLPDFLSSSAEAARIINRAPGVREAVRAAANDPDSRRPAGALEFYQVQDDQGGMDQTGGYQYTAAEREIVGELGPDEFRRFYALKDESFRASDVYPSPDINDDHRDAFRHAYWSARMAQEFGDDFANRYTTAHEALPGNQGPREAMDLHNNEVGRAIARAHPDATPEELARYIHEAVRRGDMVVVGRDGQLVYTDQIQPEDTVDSRALSRDGRPLPGRQPAPRAID
jgi:hypothetical protein